MLTANALGNPIEPLIGIYQPFYKASLIERLDAGFIPLDWMSNPTPALRELALHRHIAEDKLFAKHHLTGLLSPKFFSKTRLRSQHVYGWISDNPGHDIYLISGGSHVPYIHYNGVVRNQMLFSPIFEGQMRDLCRKIGFELPAEFPRQTNANRSAGSFWVASASFWENWISDVIAPICELIDHSVKTDEIFTYARYFAPAPVYVLTFIYERLIDFYIARNKISAIYYPWDPHSILSLDYTPSVRTYLEVMIPLVDRIDATGRWSDSERAWLQERYAAVTSTAVGQELLASDPVDYDLPKFYPKSVMTPHDKRRGAVTG
jgi:hypothetical protein